METVTISPKYQVVIPQSIREKLGVQPGQKVKMILYDRIGSRIRNQSTTNKI